MYLQSGDFCEIYVTDVVDGGHAVSAHPGRRNRRPMPIHRSSRTLFMPGRAVPVVWRRYSGER